ncbi:MAG TPA: O-methyltransferase [Anaerolineales bacterium]|jgi:caffeoyl-CoA O-methyltransferase|nr:O-methyltransferase [Anaerolineales bacterium]
MTIYNDQISSYISGLFAEEDDPLQLAREDSAEVGLPAISIKPEEGRFLQFLVRACGARKAVEIGTLGGYSGIWIARGLLPGGKLISLDRDPKHAEVARSHFAAAGLSEVIEVRIGEALDLLSELGAEAPFDFVFIDADKDGYPAYFDWAVDHIRTGGIIAAHNAFRKGSVAGIKEDDDHSALMRQFNQDVANDNRLISTIYPAGDGTLIGIKID